MDINLFDSELKVMEVLWKESDCQRLGMRWGI